MISKNKYNQIFAKIHSQYISQINRSKVSVSLLRAKLPWLQEITSWAFVCLVLFVLFFALVINHASATTSGTMKLYFHKENSDVNEAYNAMSLTPPEPAADTASTLTSTSNVNATPPTSFCESSGNTSDKFNDIGADSQAVANRCMATFISAPVGQAITMSTGDAATITGQFWSSESATQVASAMNVYIYRWTTGTTVTSGNRIATLTCAEPGTTATSCVPTALSPANNITFAASDRIIAIVSMNVTTLRAGSNVQVYFDSTARTASFIKMSYTVLGNSGANKPALTGTMDDDFTTDASTTACSTSGVAYHTKWTCLQGTATNTAGNFNAGGVSGPTGDSTQWLWLQNKTSTTAATVSNFGTTPSNTFLYQTLPTSYGSGNLTTVINSSVFYDVGATPTNSASPYSHSGLVVWTSNTDYLEIQVYSDGAINDTGTNTVHVALNNSGVLSGTQNLNSATTANSYNNIWVRFVNTTGSWQAQYSTDGTSFTNVGSPVSHAIFTRAGLNAFTAIANPITSYAGAFEWFASTLSSPTYNQAAYSWLANANSTTPGSTLNGVAQNTATSLTSAGQQFRLRTLLSASTSQVATSGQSFNLQYAALGANANCSAISSGSWTGLGAGSSWTQGTANGSGFGERQYAGVVVFNNKIWVMGGITLVGNYLHDVWSSTDGSSWTSVTSAASWPVRSAFGIAVYNNEMWIMGGQTTTGSFLHDVWHSSDGVTWNQATSAAGWTARENPRAVTFNNELWIMGGFDTTPAEKHDVWHSSDGVTWNQATSAAGWSIRENFGLVTYNSEMWLYGGTGVSRLNDVWHSSDGVTWNQATSAAGWTAREGMGASVYDNKMWVLGGITNSGGRQNDAWFSTDGVTWNQATSAAGWTARTGAISAAFNNKLWIMAGDASGSTYNDDTWYTSTGLISYYDNATPASGANISTTGNDPTDAGQTINPQTYQESDGFTNSQSAYGGTLDAMWDLSLYDNGAPAATTYCLRIAKADGAAINTYTNYPMITTYTAGPTLDQILRGGQWFNNGTKQSFYWAQ